MQLRLANLSLGFTSSAIISIASATGINLSFTITRKMPRVYSGMDASGVWGCNPQSYTTPPCRQGTSLGTSIRCLRSSVLERQSGNTLSSLGEDDSPGERIIQLSTAVDVKQICIYIGIVHRNSPVAKCERICVTWHCITYFLQQKSCFLTHRKIRQT
jgi:hypothetical protein